MTTGILHDQNLEKHIEKQMGCMAGFFQLFDRHQILTGKRLYSSTKRLPPARAVDSTPESEKSVGSPAVSRDLEKPNPTRAMTAPSPDRLKTPPPVTELRSPALEVVIPAEKKAKSPLTFPIFESKEGTRSSWKFCKEAPRLSLDSRATVAAADGDDMRRSPSVVARLMGLEPLPNSSPEPIKKAELRRSASESRLSRDLFQYRFIDNNNNFQQKQLNQSHSSNVTRSNVGVENTNASFNEAPKPSYRGAGASPWKSAQQRRSYFDAEDFFPEPKQMVSIYGEIEKRLKMRGIDEQSKDLETLKQILEALQLKGLLHSKKPSDQITNRSNRNFVYDRSFSLDQSPIVIVKPSRSPMNRRIGNDSPPTDYGTRAGVRRSLGYACECSPAASPRRERQEIDRNGKIQGRGRDSSSPTRRELAAKSPNSPARRAPSPVHSPKLSPKRNGSDQTIRNRSPINRKQTAKIDPRDKIGTVTEDESSSISESSASSSSQTGTERSKMEAYKGGSGLLERCDKLLHSIAEMNATELQPSPVSVLDSSFYKDELSSPSPVMKRSIDFKDHLGEFEEEIWRSPAISPIQSKCEDKPDDCDFIYISEIIRASNYFPEESDLFLLLEKQQYLKGNDISTDSRLQRKLIFDTITEILDRQNQLPPWKVLSSSNSSIPKPSLHQIWLEFQRIRERDTAEDLFDEICGLLRKDLAEDAINGWGDCPVETSEAVLDIERLIFKDLVGEAIRDMAASIVSAPRRKLVF